MDQGAKSSHRISAVVLDYQNMAVPRLSRLTNLIWVVDHIHLMKTTAIRIRGTFTLIQTSQNRNGKNIHPHPS